MSNVKNKLKFAVSFLIIASLVVLSFPSNLIFGEGESSDVEALQQAVTQATEALNAAQTAADDADAALAAAQTAADDADAALAAAQTAGDDAAAALAAAQTAADDAATALAAAQQAVADAQAALDGAGEDEDTEALEQALEGANAALADAQTAVDDANAALAAAQTAADDAAAAMAAAQTAADDADAALAAAQTAVDDADAAVAAAQQVLVEAQAALDAALAALEEEAGDGSGEEQEINLTIDPTLTTDKDDYNPGETVVITGTGFLPNTEYTIVVVRPDGSIVLGDGTFVPGSDVVLSDAGGGFTYNYILNGIVGTYNVEAKDSEGNTVAETSFTDCNNKVRVYKDVRNSSGNNVSDTNHFTVRLWKGNSRTGPWEEIGHKDVWEGHRAEWQHLDSYTWYKVTEDTESGYTLKSITGPQYIRYNKTKSFYIVNWQDPRTGSITVNKSGLEGSDTAIFSLSGQGGPYTPITLDNKTGGYPSSGGWSNLPYGSYTVTETWGSGNVFAYTTNLSSNPKTINVNGNETLDVTNRKCTYSVTVNKSGLDWGFWWADQAIFTLTGPAGPNSQVRTATLNNFPILGNPSVTWSGLPAGQYTLDESYPAGNNSTYTSNLVFPQSFDLGPSQTFNVVNTKITCAGTITVKKTGLEGDDTVVFALDDDQKDPVGNGQEVSWIDLECGQSYTLTEIIGDCYSQASWEVYTNDGYAETPYLSGGPNDPLPTLVIGGDNPQDYWVEVTNTKKTATVTVKKIVEGDDTFNFTLTGGTPTSFPLGNNDTQDIIVKCGDEIVITETAGSCWETTVTDDGPEGVISTDDELRKASFIVDGNNIDGLDGSTITYTNTKKTATVTVKKIVEGDDTFDFTLTGGTPTSFPLGNNDTQDIIVKCGDEIVITETAGNCWETTVTDDGPEGVISTDDELRKASFIVNSCNIDQLDGSTITFTNTKKTSTLTVEKWIDDGEGWKLVDEGTFNFSGDLGGFVLGGESSSTQFTITCGEEYTITETLEGCWAIDHISYEGVVVTNKMFQKQQFITFTATSEDGTIRFYNKRLKGSITICKTDEETGEPLLGSTFELQQYICSYAVDGTFGAAAQPICDWVTMYEIVLTEENCYTWGSLYCGLYRVVEKFAPQGWLTIDPVEVEINSGQLNHSLLEEIADPRKPGKIGIRKVDEDGNAMVGIGFTLYNSTGTTVVQAEKFTDAAGKVAFGNLAWGSYLIVETTVLSGYTKAADVPVIVNSGNAGTVIDVIIENTPKRGGGGELTVLGIQELPFTGMHPAIPISGISMILGGAAMFIASLKKRFGRK